ncbi:cell surface glycoprotein 1-like isoform X2 [Anopheles albimanus]|uniref:cell surface glycoprotein 1-like isoform X2 n=1 Tax=Anopheles albimanus TaxID=7167 RepID=UPI00164032AF|nr:cell surface glycoprotein 1-like isoform X2 [Anopheles albimanus]
MGGMLSVLVASVGAMDLIYCLAYVSSNQPAITDGSDGGEKVAAADGEQQDSKRAQGDGDDGGGGLERYRRSVQEQLDTARRTGERDGVTYAQDGVPYRDGYRVEQFDEQRLDALGVKIRELERRSQEKEQRLEQLNVQLHELERKSVEREQLLIAEVQRSRSVSRAATPEPTGSSVDRLEVAAARDSSTPVPSIVLGDAAADGTRASSSSRSSRSSSSGDERRRASGGSIKFRPIRRDDELRRSVKRRSVASNASQDDRAEELLLLSQLEADEAAQMQDYVPLVYARDDEQHHHQLQHLGDPFGRRHKISPIQELCQLHEDEDHQHEREQEPEEQWMPERSPEPTLAGTITRPWGDIKPGESKEKAIIRRSARSLSIEEEEPARLSDVEVEVAAEPIARQRSASRHTSEAVAPTAVDSGSASASATTSEQPTLRRTTKESDLASLLAVEGDDGSKPTITRTEPNDTGIEGDTECDDDNASRSRSPRLLHPSRRTPGGGSCSPSPQNGVPARRKGKERKRFTRSLTPIEFDQTFMDSFTEQRLSVSPAELEDYINSMEEISFVPPKLERPAYLYPAIQPPESIPSLVLTDEKGDDALFHDELSTAAFYGERGELAGEGRRTPNHRVNYVEWIRKFPENQTSHLSLDDYDSDDEEVEAIIRLAAATTMAEDKPESPQEGQPVFPVGLAGSTAGSPAEAPAAASVPIVTPEPQPAKIGERTEFPVHVPALYRTPSPTASGPLTDLSDLSSNASPLSLPTSPPQPGIVNDSHFTPIPSPITLSVDGGGGDGDDVPAAAAVATSPSRSPVSPLRVNLGVPAPARMMSRSPSASPVPADITAEELELFDIGHLDGLIFEAKSREPSPAPTPARNPLLSPDELAFDIGNMGGLILGPPSRSSSPLPPPSPTPPASLDAHEHDHRSEHGRE